MSVHPDDLIRYLAMTGWRPARETSADAPGRLFRCAALTDDGQPLELYVPTSDRYLDYDLRVGEILTALSVIEGTTEATLSSRIRGAASPRGGLVPSTGRLTATSAILALVTAVVLYMRPEDFAGRLSKDSCYSLLIALWLCAVGACMVWLRSEPQHQGRVRRATGRWLSLLAARPNSEAGSPRGRVVRPA